MRHEMRKKIHKFNIRKWIIKLFKELIEHLLKEHIALSKIVSNDGIPRTNNTSIILSRRLKLIKCLIHRLLHALKVKTVHISDCVMRP